MNYTRLAGCKTILDASILIRCSRKNTLEPQPINTKNMARLTLLAMSFLKIISVLFDIQHENFHQFSAE